MAKTPPLRWILWLDLVLVLLAFTALQRAARQADLPASLGEDGQMTMTPSPIGAKAGLAVGDRLVALQETPLLHPREVEQVLAGDKIGGPVRVDLLRNGKPLSLVLPSVGRFPRSFLTIQLLVGLLFLALGLFVMLKKQEDFAALLLHATLMFSGLMICVTPARYSLDPFFLSRAVDLADSLAGSLLGVLFLHFTLVFPRRKWPAEATRLPLALLYSAAALGALWDGSTKMMARYPFSIEWFRESMTAYTASRSLLCLCLLAGILIILHSLWKTVEPSDKKKLRWLLLGVGTGPMAFILLWQVPDVLGLPRVISLESSLAFLGSVPVCFTVAIVQHRLLNIDLVLRRGIFFVFLACVALIIYSLTHSLLAVVTAAILVAVLFEAQESEKLNRMKTYFIAGVSHDLKTPLANIRMYAELLGPGGKTTLKDQKEFSGIIVGEADRLTRLIDNVLDFSKIESGVRGYRLGPVELNSLVRKALETFKYQLKISGFKCKFHPAKGALPIRADEGAVAEAIVNLLSNAIKYSGKAREITVSTFRRDGFAGVEVADKGIGIAPTDQHRVFQAFQRIENENTREVGGAGLGLALVKHILDAHKGKIELKSELGQGSCFSILFPEEQP